MQCEKVNTVERWQSDMFNASYNIGKTVDFNKTKQLQYVKQNRIDAGKCKGVRQELCTNPSEIQRVQAGSTTDLGHKTIYLNEKFEEEIS